MFLSKLSTPVSTEHAEQLGRLKQQVELLTREKESLKESLDQKEKEVSALTKEKAVLQGQLKEVTVDKQSLGELTGKLASSTSEITQRTFLSCSSKYHTCRQAAASLCLHHYSLS